MIFTATTIPGAFLVQPERIADERGFFARTWSREELEARGLDGRLEYAAVSWNHRERTLRGMHYQIAPLEEAKLVCCLRGAVHDVILDLRRGSPARNRWFAARLDAVSMQGLYVPPGIAHGFLTLEDDTLVQYHLSEAWSPQHARGVRWDDPAFRIDWPAQPAVMSERDRNYRDFTRSSP